MTVSLSKALRGRAIRLVLGLDLAIIVFAVARGLMKTGNPSRYFGEGRFTTGISCGQLLITGAFAFLIFLIRRSPSADRSRTGHFIWLLMAGGFVFLAADDALQFHERFEKVIRKAFGLASTGLTDRIDDGLIAAYGVIGVAVMSFFRRELFTFRIIFPPLVLGFVFMGLSVFFDMLGNRPDIFLWLTDNLTLSKRLEAWADVGDGAFTLLAEGMFAVGLYYGWRKAKELDQPSFESPPA